MSYSRKPINAQIEEKLKFYSHYHWFLVVNGLLMFMSLRNGSGFGWLPLFIIWGTILGFHFLKVFRPAWLEGLEEHQDKYLEPPRGEDEFSLRPLKRVNVSSWQDHDLV